MSYFAWRLFIGPPFTRPSSPVHWDWSTLNIDSSYDTTALATTLTSAISAGDATVSVASTSAFPSAGGFWVGSTRWSYVRYSGKTSTTFTGCSWTGDAEEQTAHANGSTVKFWFEVTHNNGSIKWQWDLDQNLATDQWYADIGGGVVVPQSAIRHNQFALIQKATSAGGTYTNWLMGWLSNRNFSEPSAYRRQWTARIVSSPQKVAEVFIPGVRVGDLNIAADGSASAISELSWPYKERASGDYSAAEPDLTAQSAIDENTSTLWISEDVIGSTENPSATGSDPAADDELIIISTIRINKPIGEPNGYRYIELTAQGNIPYDAVMFTQDVTYISLNISGSYTAGDKIILCEDDALFQEQNPRASAALIIEVTDDYPWFFDSLDPAGYGIGVYYTTQFNEQWNHSVVWGTGTPANRGDDAEVNQYAYDYHEGTVTAPLPGQVMRYTFANNATPYLNWETDYNDHAGYQIMTTYDEPFFLVDLPALDLQLAEDISSGFTGTLTLKDSSGDTTGGLPTSGNIQVGSDVIAYNSKTPTTINVTGGVSADHVTGDLVYVYFSGVQSDGVPINTIRWTCPDIYFKDFSLRYSRLPHARSPGTSGYLDDYVELAAVTGHASNTYELTFTTTRARKVLLLPTLMSEDPARMRMNELEVLLDRTYYDTDTWLDADQPVTDLFETLLALAHIPAGAIDSTDDGFHDMNQLNTERQNAWVVIADLADYAMHRVSAGRNSQFTITADDFWTSGSSYTPVLTWTRSNATEARLLMDESGIGTISQLRLSWKSPDGADEGVSVYPASGSEDWRGDVVEIGPYIYIDSDAADAAARKQYYLRKYPGTMYLKPKSPGEFKPGEIHRIQWQFDGSWATTDRYCIVMSVQDEISDMQRSQSLNLLQVSREVPN